MDKKSKNFIYFVISILMLSACAAPEPRSDEIPADGKNNYAEVFVLTPGTTLLSIGGKEVGSRLHGVYIYLKPGLHEYFYESNVRAGTRNVDSYFKNPGTGRYETMTVPMTTYSTVIRRATVKLEAGKRYKWEPTLRRIVYRDFELKRVMGMFPENEQDLSNQPIIGH